MEAPAGPRIVEVADLSRPPRTSGDHGSILNRHFPRRARQLGIEGRVRARIRILPDGRIRVLSIAEENPPDQKFDRACRAALREARFEPLIDRDGNPVAVNASYNCEFTVGL